MGIENIYDDGVNVYYGGSGSDLEILREEQGKDYDLFIGRADMFFEPVVHWLRTDSGSRSYLCSGTGCPICALIDAYVGSGNPALVEKSKKLHSVGGGVTVVGVWDGKEYKPMLLKLVNSTRKSLKKIKQLVGMDYGFEVVLTVGDDWRRTIQYLPQQRLNDKERQELIEKIQSYDLTKYRYIFGRKIKDVKEVLTSAGLFVDFQTMVPNWQAYLDGGFSGIEKTGDAEPIEKAKEDGDDDLWKKDDDGEDDNLKKLMDL